MPRRAISSGSTATRWRKVFRREPPEDSAAGSCSTTTRRSFSLRTGRSTPSTSKTARRRSRPPTTMRVTVTAPRRALGSRRRARLSPVSIVRKASAASSGRSMRRPARESGGSTRPRIRVSPEARRGKVSRPKSAAAAAAIRGSPAPTIRAFTSPSGARPRQSHGIARAVVKRTACRSSTPIRCWRWMSPPASWRGTTSSSPVRASTSTSTTSSSTSIFPDTRTSPVSRWARPASCGISIGRPDNSSARWTPACRT